MRVVTPAINLDLRIDKIEVSEGQLSLTGVAGMMPCETTLKPSEIRRLLWLALRLSTVLLMLRKDPPAPKKKFKKEV